MIHPGSILTLADLGELLTQAATFDVRTVRIAGDGLADIQLASLERQTVQIEVGAENLSLVQGARRLWGATETDGSIVRWQASLCPWWIVRDGRLFVDYWMEERK